MKQKQVRENMSQPHLCFPRGSSYARVLVRTHVDGKAAHRTTQKTKTMRGALSPTLTVWPPHVFHRNGTGLSPLIHT